MLIFEITLANVLVGKVLVLDVPKVAVIVLVGVIEAEVVMSILLVVLFIGLLMVLLGLFVVFDESFD